MIRLASGFANARTGVPRWRNARRDVLGAYESATSSVRAPARFTPAASRTAPPARRCRRGARTRPDPAARGACGRRSPRRTGPAWAPRHGARHHGEVSPTEAARVPTTTTPSRSRPSCAFRIRRAASPGCSPSSSGPEEPPAAELRLAVIAADDLGDDHAAHLEDDRDDVDPDDHGRNLARRDRGGAESEPVGRPAPSAPRARGTRAGCV